MPGFFVFLQHPRTSGATKSAGITDSAACESSPTMASNSGMLRQHNSRAQSQGPPLQLTKYGGTWRGKVYSLLAWVVTSAGPAARSPLHAPLPLCGSDGHG